MASFTQFSWFDARKITPCVVRCLIKTAEGGFPVWLGMCILFFFSDAAPPARMLYARVATPKDQVFSVGSAKPAVDCWLSGSNKTSTRACHGFESHERQAVVIACRDAITNDRGNSPGKLLIVLYASAWFREGRGRRGKPDYYTSS